MAAPPHVGAAMDLHCLRGDAGKAPSSCFACQNRAEGGSPELPPKTGGNLCLQAEPDQAELIVSPPAPRSARPKTP